MHRRKGYVRRQRRRGIGKAPPIFFTPLPLYPFAFTKGDRRRTCTPFFRGDRLWRRGTCVVEGEGAKRYMLSLSSISVPLARTPSGYRCTGVKAMHVPRTPCTYPSGVQVHRGIGVQVHRDKEEAPPE